MTSSCNDPDGKNLGHTNAIFSDFSSYDAQARIKPGFHDPGWLKIQKLVLDAPVYFCCHLASITQFHSRLLHTRDATLAPKPITGIAPHHRIANDYRQLPADYGSLTAFIWL